MQVAGGAVLVLIAQPVPNVIERERLRVQQAHFVPVGRVEAIVAQFRHPVEGGFDYLAVHGDELDAEGGRGFRKSTQRLRFEALNIDLDKARSPVDGDQTVKSYGRDFDDLLPPLAPKAGRFGGVRDEVQ